MSKLIAGFMMLLFFSVVFFLYALYDYKTQKDAVDDCRWACQVSGWEFVKIDYFERCMCESRPEVYEYVNATQEPY